MIGEHRPTSDFAGRRVLVTGGSLGIGHAVSCELAHRGAQLVIVARGGDEIEQTIDLLPGDGHHGHRLDVSDGTAWSAATDVIARGGALHGLVTAAGVLGPIGTLDQISPREFIRTIEINLIGTMLALHCLLRLLRASNGRAVTFSGGGATTPLARYDAYAASKAAVVRLTENVAASSEVEVNCVAPGFVATRMHEGTINAGPEVAGTVYHARTAEQLAQGGFPASEAAQLVAFLLSDEARGISGRLLSAQWDPWREEEFHARLRADPALATLRRIDDQAFAHAVR